MRKRVFGSCQSRVVVTSTLAKLTERVVLMKLAGLNKGLMLTNLYDQLNMHRTGLVKGASLATQALNLADLYWGASAPLLLRGRVRCQTDVG